MKEGTKKVISIFHKSLFDWLTNESENEISEYYCSMESANKLFGKSMIEKWKKDQFSSLNKEGKQYMLEYGIIHLVETNQVKTKQNNKKVIEFISLLFLSFFQKLFLDIRRS